MAMADKGYTKGLSLGRHVLGSNYFRYAQDPWSSFSMSVLSGNLS